MPKTLSSSHSAHALQSGAAKLWILLVGVNHYEDEGLLSLHYPAPDCQGLGQALMEATQAFPRREVRIHHDYSERSPTLESVRQGLQAIAAATQPQDTILFYFSGHGAISPASEQAVLCLRDTCQDYLLESGLPLQELLRCLGQSPARQQLVWLDACHSGGMTLWGARGDAQSRSKAGELGRVGDPTPQLIEVLCQRAAQGRGFYALLSCDQDQRSWEFPELGHGVFTYYLMRGLRGEAADHQGVIDADGLYKYVYHQTLRYIDKANQQIRLVNRQKRSKGDGSLQSEYPLQTPKRIVEGMGELILGIKPQQPPSLPLRRALIVEGLASYQTTLALSKVLQGAGQFAIEYWPQPGRAWSQVREAIQDCLAASDHNIQEDVSTVLLYLRGQVGYGDAGEAWLELGDGVRLSRSWLRTWLRRARKSQQILVLDFPGAAHLTDWVEDLQNEGERGQCIIAAAALPSEPEQFAQALLETLKTADLQAGLPVAAWISQLQVQLAGTGLAAASDDITPLSWLSGQGVIEALPSTLGRSASDRTDSVDLGVCPYLGLSPFSEAQAQYFYGRQDLAQDLLAALGQQPALAVVGASGSGKSSVVRAGLMAQLRQGKQLPGSDQWWIRAMRPGTEPLKALAQSLTDPGTEREKAYQQLQIEGLLHLGADGFVQWLRSRSEPMVVLVVDQFEELFTLTSPGDRQVYLDLLWGALGHAGDRFKLVLTLRADFVAPCLEYPALANILKRSSRFVPPCLSHEAYRDVIVQPAEQVGLQVETGLLELLQQDLTQAPGELPLLEFVLEKLWEKRQAGRLSVQSYQQIGGLKGALEQHAQAVYNSLEPAAQDCAQWIFLSLTQLGDGVADTRRRLPRSALSAAKYPTTLVDATLQTLIAAKLVVISTEDASGQTDSIQSRGKAVPMPSDEPPPDSPTELPPTEPTLEVVHEILIRHWSTLQWWIAENRTRLQIQRQVEQLAALWRDHGRQADDLLRGGRLAEAEDLYIHHTDELPLETQTFIEASLEARQQIQQQLKRQLRRTQMTAAVIGAFGLAALVLGGVAYRQTLLAKLEAVEALTASSEALLWSNQQLEALAASAHAGQELLQMGGLGRWLRPMAWRDARLQTAAALQQAITLTSALNRLDGHVQAVNAVQFSPDGQMLASASDDGTVRLWRRDGQPLATLEQPPETAWPPSRATHTAFSPDGQTLAVARDSGRIELWGGLPGSPTLAHTLEGHPDWVTHVAFSPDGQSLASASRDRTLRLWSLSDRTHRSFIGHQGWVNHVAFSPDGQTLASASDDKTARLWAIAGGENRILSGHGDRVASVSISPKGQQLASAGADGTVRLWAMATGAPVDVFSRADSGNPSRDNQINDVVFSPEGDTLAIAQADGQIQIWLPEAGRRRQLLGHGGEVLAVQFSPDGQMLASASADETVRLWNPATSPQLSATGVYSVAIQPTSDSTAPLVAIAGWDGRIALWRYAPATGAALVTTLEGHQTPIEALAFSPDGTLLASAGSDPHIALWRVANGAQIATLEGNLERVAALAFSPDGTLLASAGDGPHLKLWPIAPALERAASSVSISVDHADGVTSLSFSPDGQWLLTGSYDHTVKLWQVSSSPQPGLRLLDTLKAHKAAVAAVIFSPDGQRFASGSWDNTLQLWQLHGRPSQTTVEPLQTLTGSIGGVSDVSFIPNGQALFSSSANGSIYLWRAASPQPVKRLAGHRGPVHSLAVSADGQWLVSGEENGGAIIWNLEIESLLQRSCSQLNNYLHTNSTLTASQRQLCSGL